MGLRNGPLATGCGLSVPSAGAAARAGGVSGGAAEAVCGHGAGGPYALALPFVESGIGLLLIGLLTRPALVAAMLVLMSLVLGSSLLEQWATVGTQLLYGLYIFTLLLHVQHNRLGLDRVGRHRWTRNRSRKPLLTDNC